MENVRPIYILIPSTKVATYSDFGQNVAGELVQIDKTKLSPKIIYSKRTDILFTDIGTLKELLRQQFEKLSKNANNQNTNTNFQKIEKMDSRILDTAIVTVKNQNGTVEAQRLESAKGTKRSKTVTLSINTTACAALTISTVILGDAFGTIATKAGVGAIEAGTVIGGTFGAATLSVLQKYSGGKPFVIKGMQIQTTEATGACFSNQLMFVESIDIQNVLKEEIVDFNMTQDGSQFNAFQRLLSNFKMCVDAENGLKIAVAQGQTVTFTMNIESVEGATVQQLF